MDAGVCTTCQHTLGQFDPEGMLGLFPRVRCGACGLVNVLVEGAMVSSPVASSYVAEPVAEPVVEAEAEAEVQPEFEQPSIEAPPPFAEAEEQPGYEDNADYEQPAQMGGAIPEEYEQEVPEIPSEPTRISIDPGEGEENN